MRIFFGFQVHPEELGRVDPGEPPLPGGVTRVVRFLLDDVPGWIQIGGLALAGVAVGVAVFIAVRHRSAIAAWFAGLSTAGIVALAALLLAGAGGSAVAGYHVHEYTQYDNAFCTSCHVMVDAYVRFEESAHAELSCHDCHQQPLSASLRQLYLWVRDRPEDVGPHAPVPDAFCASCHVDDDPERWPQIAASLGHRVHLESDDPELDEVMCVACHGVSVHTFSPVATTCGECHEDEAEVRIGDMMADRADTELHCVLCHDFLADEPAELEGLPEGMAVVPERETCVRCHEMEEAIVAAELLDDPHGAVCGACHNPHVDDEPVDAAGRCQDCHVDAEALSAFHRGRHEIVFPDCMACHSAHSWRVEGLECLDCHEEILEGPQPAAGNHPVIPGDGESPYFAADRGGPEGFGDGGPSVLPAFVPDAPGPVGSDTVDRRRPFDHRDHRDFACVECHRTGNDEHGVVTVRTAEQCGACHHDPARGYECATCHAELPEPTAEEVRISFTVWEEPGHRNLPFDHETHDGLACEDCHSPTPLMDVEVGCTDCHVEHHEAEATCTSCHVPAPPSVHDVDTHATCSGSGCHADVTGTRPLMTRSVCLMCHTDQVDHRPGQDCKACHMVPERPLRTADGP